MLKAKHIFSIEYYTLNMYAFQFGVYRHYTFTTRVCRDETHYLGNCVLFVGAEMIMYICSKPWLLEALMHILAQTGVLIGLLATSNFHSCIVLISSIFRPLSSFFTFSLAPTSPSLSFSLLRFSDNPPLLLISLDGFRYDYLDRGLSPNIMSLGQSLSPSPFLSFSLSLCLCL